MTPAILASKRHRRYLERIWRSNPTTLNRSRLTRQRYLCNRQISKAKSAHYCKIIAEHSGDCGSIWKAFSKILHRFPKMHLPDHSSIAALANTFSSFCINKISVIYSSFPSDSYIVSFGFGEADFLMIRHARYSYLQNLVQLYSMYMTCQAYNNIRQKTKQTTEVKRKDKTKHTGNRQQ